MLCRTSLLLSLWNCANGMLIIMNKIRHKTIAQLVVEQLREKIICGEIKPGQRINLDEIANLMVLREPKENEAIRVAIVRQSGNEQRALGVLTVEDGLHEVHKFFNVIQD